ncbi:hypothetical protein DS901_11445 [Loktanella sp. D2R18]|uniref:sensor histidine kinase n=1 Tax=Rhodobacterales TaxID=204455 RepID=UPI000DE8A2C1|nr:MULTISPECIES: sensor histidine kinase [Rhodobacterales]MDO6590340.1 sensor histidine kinase [Yoonia sp. 1_MG-2023]RBW42857.1 hypothetical protein DS901_11445 [Loktanella sp. D2R18]
MIKGPWYKSLRAQIAALMTLALLPLGSVAVFQTNQVAEKAREDAELALLALTEHTARTEQLVIERAFGAAQFLSAVAPKVLADPETCQETLTPFLARNDDFSFVGLLPVSGVITCSTLDRALDLSNAPGFDEDMAAQKRTIIVSSKGPASQESVFVVSEPYYLESGFAGFVSVSIRHSELRGATDSFEQPGLIELITFNDDGEILTARTSREGAAMELPKDRALAALRTDSSIGFHAPNTNGIDRRYTVVPISGSPATVMAIWAQEGEFEGEAPKFAKPALFPILMWFASMGVALLAMHTLVLRHLKTIRKNMLAFADSRHLGERSAVANMPTELQAVNENFLRMADTVMHDEALLEDALREKGVLVKEIHHRVKNNLQLISSIMNMQIRAAEHEETKSVIARLQDRVLSLATIHRDLYQSQHAGMVNVGGLITEVVEKTFEMARAEDTKLSLETAIDQVLLYPDQAVPLSLLATEATTNALKYVGANDGSTPWIKVRLTQDGDDCTLTLSNSLGDRQTRESTGLGSQLMGAFAIQLGAKMDTEETYNSYTTTLRFQVQEFEPEARDF